MIRCIGMATAMATLGGCTLTAGELDRVETDTGDAARVEPLAPRFDLPDHLGTPEGVTFHASSRTFFTGSIEFGSLYSIEETGEVHELFHPNEDGWSTMGLNIDGDRVLACAVQFASTRDAMSELWIHDLHTGSTDRVPLAGEVTNCNDLVVVDRIAYLTDREDGVLHWVHLDALESGVLVRDWRLESWFIGGNGIRHDEEANVLLVSQFSPARLIRIDLEDPTDIHDVYLTSGELAGWFPNGPDGMTWFGDQLVLASHDTTHLLTSEDGWFSAHATEFDNAHTIEAVVEAEGRLYGLHGNVAAYVLGFGEALPYHLVELLP